MDESGQWTGWTQNAAVLTSPVLVFLARSGADKQEIRREIGERFHYDPGRTVDAIRPGYHFDVSCQGSVPEAIVAFLDVAF